MVWLWLLIQGQESVTLTSCISKSKDLQLWEVKLSSLTCLGCKARTLTSQYHNHLKTVNWTTQEWVLVQVSQREQRASLGQAPSLAKCSLVARSPSQHLLETRICSYFNRSLPLVSISSLTWAKSLNAVSISSFLPQFITSLYSST